MRRGSPLLALLPSLILGSSAPGAAQGLAPPVPPAAYSQLRWRMIGPFRASRTVPAVGVPGRPAVLYIGVANGGVWRSTDYGRTWQPIFDDQPTGSIGAIAIAPSNPKVVYVGTGEGLQRPDLSTGDGIYRSDDGGDHWTHLGLRDGQQIPAIAVDPRDPDRLLVAVLGHPYGPNPERGIFRSTDGGKTFRKVLYRDEDTGGMDVVMDPSNPDVVYADMWAARQAPWEIGSSLTESAKNGLWKSTDGGEHWRQLTRGLPGAAEGLGRIGITIAPSAPNRLYLVLGADRGGGLYRSDDAGESWSLANPDERLWGRDGDFNEVKVDPGNPDVVYVANVVAWKSSDGGKTFHAFRGAPGGDDYHRFWIDPTDPKTILLASDQGAVVTQNGGATWSSWYNQPTAEFYHVSTDNAFPYRVCGGQQESGSACVSSRGDAGEITFWDWHPVGAEEYAYVAPDPLDPDIVYGDKVTRYDRRTGQTMDVTPRPLRGRGSPEPDGTPYRTVRTLPLLFAPTDPRTLYFATNTVWKTTDGGNSWQRISPDLTRPPAPPPANLGSFTALDPEKGRHRGVIYTLAPSYVDGRVIWAGTDDGLIHVATDGGAHWTDVTPPALKSRPWAKVSLMDAGRFDAGTAYAAVNTFRLDDLRPHVFRTHDGGRSWTEIVSGLPDGAIVNVVREDPVRRGLLYAGSETGVWVSFDDGGRWQSLRLNMPATSIRDLVVKDNDLVVATHGRGFWILDAMSALRELQATTSHTATLFTPGLAWRVRFSNYTDTPLPPDEPMAPNPPDGAAIDYFLATPARSVALEIRDAGGALVRRYEGTEPDQIVPRDTGNVPAYWVRPPQSLGASAGAHRFVWDLRHATPAFPNRGFPISAVAGRTPLEPRGPWALPGRYTARLIVDGRPLERAFELRMDPRVKTPAEGLRAQAEAQTRIAAALDSAAAILAEARALRQRMTRAGDVELRAKRGEFAALDTVVSGITGLGGVEGGDRVGTRPRGARSDNVARVVADLQSLYEMVDAADVAPTTQIAAAIAERLSAFDALLARWRAVRVRLP